MKISQPYFFNEIGKRLNQEDSVYPVHPSGNDNLFMVCDGMGGHEYGEVASSVVCESIASFFKTANKENFSIDMFKRALAFAYDELDKQGDASETKGVMGTTLTFLYLASSKAYIAHIGDSRVYHIRTAEGQSYIINKTFDHSLVNELLRDGIITEEEAASHPNKNIITRAVQPVPAKRCEADFYVADDIVAGDYFFLCSDGVLESISDDLLIEILSEDAADSDKLDKIKELCRNGSRDNNSAYLIHIEDIEHSNAAQQRDFKGAERVEIQDNNPIVRKSKQSSPLHQVSNISGWKKSLGMWKYIIPIVILVIIVCFLLYKFGYIPIEIKLHK